MHIHFSKIERSISQRINPMAFFMPQTSLNIANQSETNFSIIRNNVRNAIMIDYNIWHTLTYHILRN